MSALIFIVGPTASGKSALALRLAQRFDAEIISADSVQFYQELVIGSARPSPEELLSIKHHLVGHVSVAIDYTAGMFEREALEIIQRHPSKPFIVCGGSGFYVQALEKGMYPIEAASAEIQERIESEIDLNGLAAAYEELKRRDAPTAEKIAPQDRYRIVRALEILEQLGGKRLSDVKREFETSMASRFPNRRVATLGISIDREALARRVRFRTEEMLSAGLIDEVEVLIKAGFRDRPQLQSVGYRETLQFLNREIANRSDLKESISQGTMRLAKKQRTWFGRSESTHWIDFDAPFEQAVSWAEPIFLRT